MTHAAQDSSSQDGRSPALCLANGSASDPSVSDALQYADGLPADCWADRCIIELAAEVVRLRECAQQLATALEGASKRHQITLAEMLGDDEPTFDPPAPSRLDNIKAIGAALAAYRALSQNTGDEARRQNTNLP